MFIAEGPEPYCAPKECHVAGRPLIFVRGRTKNLQLITFALDMALLRSAIGLAL